MRMTPMRKDALWLRRAGFEVRFEQGKMGCGLALKDAAQKRGREAKPWGDEGDHAVHGKGGHGAITGKGIRHATVHDAMRGDGKGHRLIGRDGRHFD